MNIGEFIKATDSRHWLAAVLVFAGVLSYYIPDYGWRDTLEYEEKALRPKVANARASLSKLKALSEGDVTVRMQRKAEFDALCKKEKDRFSSYGFEPLPEGSKAVFTAQSRVNEALAKRDIRIVINEASVAGSNPSGAVVSPRKTDAGGVAANKPMTADEYRRQVEKAASKMSDKTVREMFLADARVKIARMKDAEKRMAARKKKAQRASVARNAGGGSVKTARPPFRSSTVEYAAQGDFKDVFMFLVGETYILGNYSFYDISVVKRADSSMDFSFTLKVDHK